ncbi:hypothetical protein Xoosp13_34 [Xanthomonas phage Xoo-sp13]|nr:hypothetical protein Xoosp13_34 [Xanthomonas phage Xoo-sp13]
MARYTNKMLDHDLKGINEIAKERGGTTYLKETRRNGYTGLDEYSIETNKCIRNLQCGTPNECLSTALNWAI